MTWIKAHLLELYAIQGALWALSLYLVYNVWLAIEGNPRTFPIICSTVAVAASAMVVTVYARMRRLPTAGASRFSEDDPESRQGD